MGGRGWGWGKDGRGVTLKENRPSNVSFYTTKTISPEDIKTPPPTFLLIMKKEVVFIVYHPNYRLWPDRLIRGRSHLRLILMCLR